MKVHESFERIWSIKKKNQKRRKGVKTPKFMTPIHRWFSGRKPEVTGAKLTFSRSNRHDCPVQPIESSTDMPKLVIISHQSKKKWHLEGKKIHPGKIPLYKWDWDGMDWKGLLWTALRCGADKVLHLTLDQYQLTYILYLYRRRGFDKHSLFCWIVLKAQRFPLGYENNARIVNAVHLTLYSGVTM